MNSDPEAVLSPLAVSKTNHKKAIKAIKTAKPTTTMEELRHLDCAEISSIAKTGSHGKDHRGLNDMHSLEYLWSHSYQNFYKDLGIVL